MKKLWLLAPILLLVACVGVPEGLQPVSGFELSRYLGKWYEIARLDHPFERGLSRVTAEYSRQDDGGVRVVNRGYSEADEKWQQAEGKAYFVQEPDVGQLKVSFFGPFYGGYNIIALDKEHYQYALVAGPNRSYLWILARTPQLPESVLSQLLEQAKESGFATDELIIVEHE